MAAHNDDDDSYDSHSSPPTKMARVARAMERCCCGVLTYTPLVFVYGLTTSLVWAVVTISRDPGHSTWLGT